jgi:hypothetical protein
VAVAVVVVGSQVCTSAMTASGAAFARLLDASFRMRRTRLSPPPPRA